MLVYCGGLTRVDSGGLTRMDSGGLMRVGKSLMLPVVHPHRGTWCNADVRVLDTLLAVCVHMSITSSMNTNK